MGSSVRKKKDKQKDFQKPKLKVGKAKAKPLNFTDTSFKSKSIVLKQQSIATTTPSATGLFTHHLSLLSHRSDTQRRESLAYLTGAIAFHPATSPLPQPVAIILPKLLPIFQDSSNSVRGQLVKLLRRLPENEIEEHVHTLLLYTQLGLNHLASDIRWTALEILDWLLAVAGDEVVSSVGGWSRTLGCFLVLLGWQGDNTTKWSSGRASFSKASSEGKMLAKQLHVLASFLRAGLGSPQHDLQEAGGACTFPLWHTRQHSLPERSSCYDYLNLFGQPREQATELYDNAEDRRRLFIRDLPVVEQGLESIVKEGGEVGRVAAGALKTLKECIQLSHVDEIVA